MSLFLRAAGVAAAMAIAIFGTPSQAWELSTPTFFTPEPGIAAPHLGEGVLPGSLADPAPATSAPATPAPAAPAPAIVAPALAPLTAPPPPEPQVRRSLAELVGIHASPTTEDSEHECLANAVYFESKGEPLSGQLSVADVVLNRAGSGRFPRSVCGVVKQRGQFSFVRGGRLPPVPRASAAWHKAVAVARIARQDLADSPASRALFFHATRVNPGWRGLTPVATVGNHIFYR
ncbi:MAG TPA: cell wall hydrolase [Allosphingosinicella sp.]|nr:cell wall hydrolase [Allosphingosinicella sp.]